MLRYESHCSNLLIHNTRHRTRAFGKMDTNKKASLKLLQHWERNYAIEFYCSAIENETVILISGLSSSDLYLPSLHETSATFLGRVMAKKLKVYINDLLAWRAVSDQIETGAK